MNQTLPLIYITSTLLNDTAKVLASFSSLQPSEGVVYWFGIELGATSVITTLVVPDADATAGQVVTSPAANAAAITVAVGTPLVLVGQAHSHPYLLVGHSLADDRETFAQFPGALSVVVPFYGRRGLDLHRCGVHRHLDGQYRRIEPAAIEDHVRVLPGLADLRASHE